MYNEKYLTYNKFIDYNGIRYCADNTNNIIYALKGKHIFKMWELKNVKSMINLFFDIKKIGDEIFFYHGMQK